MELRGFDSYPITLGDEMRGERASLGKELDDVECDLRIKRRMIVAIENCDLEGFPNRSVVAGYVRSYARYLGLDADDCYRRFCAESGYQSPVAMIARDAGRAGASLPLLPVGVVGPEIAHSRFAMPPMRSRYMATISLGAITSTLALLALMAGLGYGGYALLQDIQRVGFAPLPQAPTVVAQAPLIAAPGAGADTFPAPEVDAYRDGGALAGMAPPAPLQSVAMLRRDGPISAIDPRTAGVFAPEMAPEDAARLADVDSADDAIRLARLERQARRHGDGGPIPAASHPQGAAAMALAAISPEAAAATPDMTTLAMAGPGAITLHASEKAWVRVRAEGNVIFEGILDAGEHYKLPPRAEEPELKAGNAGGIFILVDGVPYGPLGNSGQIARHVSLLASDVRASVPRAEASSASIFAATSPRQRAEASVAMQ